MEPIIQNPGPIEAPFYSHQNQEAVDHQLMQQNHSTTETQVFNYQNQAAQEAKLSQRNLNTAELPIFHCHNQVSHDVQVTQQNHAAIDLPTVNYPSQVTRGAQLHRQIHFQNQIAQETPFCQQSGMSSDSSTSHYQNQATRGSQIRSQSLVVSKPSMSSYQNQTSEELQVQTLNIVRTELKLSQQNTVKSELKLHPKKSLVNQMHSLNISEDCRTQSVSFSQAADEIHSSEKSSNENHEEIFNRKLSRTGLFIAKNGSAPQDQLLSHHNVIVSESEKNHGIVKMKQTLSTEDISTSSCRVLVAADAQIYSQSNEYQTVKDGAEQNVSYSCMQTSKRESHLDTQRRGKQSFSQETNETSKCDTVNSLLTIGTSNIHNLMVAAESNVSLVFSTQPSRSQDRIMPVETVSLGKESAVALCESKCDSEVSFHHQSLGMVTLQPSNDKPRSSTDHQSSLSVSSSSAPCLQDQCFLEDIEVRSQIEPSCQEEKQLMEIASHIHSLNEKISNAHLLPRPPDILSTLPVETECKDDGITLSSPTESGFLTVALEAESQPSLQSQDDSDDSGQMFTPFYDGSCTVAECLSQCAPHASPPLLTPPCVTPPPSLPPSSPPVIDPSTPCSPPSTPHSSTPPFSSPLSSSPSSLCIMSNTQLGQFCKPLESSSKCLLPSAFCLGPVLQPSSSALPQHEENDRSVEQDIETTNKSYDLEMTRPGSDDTSAHTEPNTGINVPPCTIVGALEKLSDDSSKPEPEVSVPLNECSSKLLEVIEPTISQQSQPQPLESEPTNSQTLAQGVLQLFQTESSHSCPQEEPQQITMSSHPTVQPTLPSSCSPSQQTLDSSPQTSLQTPIMSPLSHFPPESEDPQSPFMPQSLQDQSLSPVHAPAQSMLHAQQHFHQPPQLHRVSPGLPQSQYEMEAQMQSPIQAHHSQPVTQSLQVQSESFLEGQTPCPSDEVAQYLITEENGTSSSQQNTMLELTSQNDQSTVAEYVITSSDDNSVMPVAYISPESNPDACLEPEDQLPQPDEATSMQQQETLPIRPNGFHAPIPRRLKL